MVGLVIFSASDLAIKFANYAIVEKASSILELFPKQIIEILVPDSHWSLRLMRQIDDLSVPQFADSGDMQTNIDRKSGHCYCRW